MKKLFAVLMAIALVLSMGTTMAFAAGDGSITIKNAFDGSEYKIYQMLNFEPSNDAGDKGVYTIVPGWEDFFANNANFVVTNNAGKATVTLKEELQDDAPALQQIAVDAIKYAKDNTDKISATATATADAPEGQETATVEFTGLKLGYYAIDTALGTICALTNTNSDYFQYEKNEKPGIDKFVKEDSTGEWQKVNDADIDQKVEYKSTITVGKGATNYVMHDTMESGLTFNNDVTIEVNGTAITTGFTVNTDSDDCTFDVVFNNDYIASLAQGTEIVVYYSATLNEGAKIVEDGNDNEVYLTYGEDNEWETAKDWTSTYTWKIDVLKYTMDGESKVTLAGAKFQLLDKDGKAIKFTDVTVEGGVPTYKVDAEGTVTEITTDANGKFEIVGLDEGSYKLRETEAPEGYNKLAQDLDVVITSEYDQNNRTAEYFFEKTNENNEKENVEPSIIEVENKTGGLFPETGGIGTTIFYLVGGLLMLGAFVFLVSKKRMATAA